jgi:hypothetical protein
MGLSIHYSGAIKAKHLLPDLIAEVKTLAETHKWDYFIFENSFSATQDNRDNTELIYGICFTPTGSETIDICFSQNGRMTSLLHQRMWQDASPEEAEKYMYLLSVKTQAAGVETHAIIINFFKHISSKYLKDFELSDEGYYWETGDKQILKNQFRKYSRVLDSFSLAMESTPPESKEKILDYLERIAEKTDKYLKNNKHPHNKNSGGG